MAKTGWLELCRQACCEKDPRRMIELAQQAVDLWDVEHATEQDARQEETNNPTGPKRFDGE